MQHVKTTPEMFRQELRGYADWPKAFAREMLANALDEGASRIEVEFVGEHTIAVTDDGPGMTAAHLDEYFFRLGRSSKGDGPTIGGFGRARVLTCFAQDGYRIRTRTLQVQGVGGQYTIEDGHPDLAGTRFEVDLADRRGPEVRDALEALLSVSHLTPTVVVDGQERPRLSPMGRATRILRDADGRPWARLWVRPNEHPFGVLLVRAGGLAMHGRRQYASDDHVVIDLYIARSRDILTSARDGLRAEFQAQVDEFLSDLGSNRRKAMKKPTKPLANHVLGGGFMVTELHRELDEPTPGQADGTFGLQPAAAHGAPPPVPLEPRSAAVGALLEAETYSSSGLGFDAFVFADDATGMSRAVRDWDPSSWTWERGTRRRKLLLVWREVCAVYVHALLDLHGSRALSWTVGWTLNEDVRADCRRTSGGWVFALNPIDGKGRTRYRLSDPADLRKIAAYAAHEVAHVLNDRHDEDFASTLTELVGAVDPAVLRRRMAAVQRGPA